MGFRGISSLMLEEWEQDLHRSFSLPWWKSFMDLQVQAHLDGGLATSGHVTSTCSRMRGLVGHGFSKKHNKTPKIKGFPGPGWPCSTNPCPLHNPSTGMGRENPRRGSGTSHWDPPLLMPKICSTGKNHSLYAALKKNFKKNKNKQNFIFLNC